jgi:hypothetical protein
VTPRSSSDHCGIGRPRSVQALWINTNFRSMGSGPAISSCPSGKFVIVMIGAYPSLAKPAHLPTAGVLASSMIHPIFNNPRKIDFSHNLCEFFRTGVCLKRRASIRQRLGDNYRCQKTPPADLQPVVGQLPRSPRHRWPANTIPPSNKCDAPLYNSSPGAPVDPYVYTFAPRLHQKPGKVQMKKMPILVVIVVSKRDIQRYVLIRVFIYTISRERRACPQEWVPHPRVPVISAVVQRYIEFRRICPRSPDGGYSEVFPGVKIGAKKCKRV